MALEGRRASGGEPRSHAATTVPEGSGEGDVASLLQGRQLLRQRRVREVELVAKKRELGPVGGRKQRDERQARGRVYQLVEAGRSHRATFRAVRRRTEARSIGPPSMIITAT